jgi:hypothetical protein
VFEYEFYIFEVQIILIERFCNFSDVYVTLLVLAEDDTSIESDVKVPILIAFHRHIYDNDWHFGCEYAFSFAPFCLKLLIPLGVK